MKLTIKTLLILPLLGLLLAGCQSETPEPAKKAPEVPAPKAEPAKAPPQQAAGWTGTVVETADAAGYTYVQVDTGSEKIWAAAPKFNVKVGDEVVVPQGMAMENYHSKTLERDFPVVYFVDSVMVGGADTAMAAPGGMPDGHPDISGGGNGGGGSTAAPTPSDIDFSGLKPAEGGKTVEQIIQGSADLAGKQVSVRGKVVKYNSEIMGKNWLHIQDGTGTAGSNDLTVTTAETADIGDTVLVTGQLVTDKDFGYGYKYDVLIEDAKVKVE